MVLNDHAREVVLFSRFQKVQSKDTIFLVLICNLTHLDGDKEQGPPVK